MTQEAVSLPFCSLFIAKYLPECEFSCRNLITCSALVFSKINHCSQFGKKACIDGVYLRTFWAKQLNDKEVKSATLPRFSLLRVLARDERPDTVADNELSPMHLAAAQVPFSGTRCPQVLLLKCVSTARGGKLVPGSSCVAESPDPLPHHPRTQGCTAAASTLHLRRLVEKLGLSVQKPKRTLRRGAGFH